LAVTLIPAASVVAAAVDPTHRRSCLAHQWDLFQITHCPVFYANWNLLLVALSHWVPALVPLVPLVLHSVAPRHRRRRLLKARTV
jgi:hypothetical protein